ncbi:MAG: YkgJ family cysteine cluster protein [Myxococcales bacterium]|nr:YkgJ family cysteine cluster protein [Myxococcales bacterium]
MDPDEVYRSLAAALRRANDATAKNERDIAGLHALVDQLVYLLSRRGELAPGHKKALERIREQAARDVRPKVRLRMYVDKYQVPGGDIDCEARLPLCHGRCCAFSFELTTQDLDEGKVRWEVLEPYLIRHEPDGYCTHIERGSLGCSIYHDRPAACRGFDCRGDARVWIDFENRIPAPMPDGLVRPRPGSLLG